MGNIVAYYLNILKIHKIRNDVQETVVQENIHTIVMY